MADWLEAYHELRERLNDWSDVSMGCHVGPSPQIESGDVLLADFKVVTDTKGQILYVTMVPREGGGDDG